MRRDIMIHKCGGHGGKNKDQKDHPQDKADPAVAEPGVRISTHGVIQSGIMVFFFIRHDVQNLVA